MNMTKEVTVSEIEAKLGKVDALFAELTSSKLIVMGKEYDLSEWKTLSDYAKKHDYSIARVQTWIARGVIPDDCVIVVPELNYLKLVHDRPYETRATS